MRMQNKIDIFNVKFDDIPFWRKPAVNVLGSALGSSFFYVHSF